MKYLYTIYCPNKCGSEWRTTKQFINHACPNLRTNSIKVKTSYDFGAPSIGENIIRIEANMANRIKMTKSIKSRIRILRAIQRLNKKLMPITAKRLGEEAGMSKELANYYKKSMKAEGLIKFMPMLSGCMSITPSGKNYLDRFTPNI